MPFVDTNTLPTGERLPGWKGRSFNSDSMTFAHYCFDAGSRIPEHCHSNEEVWTVLEGELEVSVATHLIHAGPGFVAIVPPYNAHRVVALTDGKAIVTDCPVRVDPSGGRRGVVRVNFEALHNLPQDMPGAPCHIPFALHNSGQTEVLIRELRVESGFSSHLPPATTTVIPCGELADCAVLEPGETCSKVVSQLSRSDVKDPDGLRVFYVKGVVIYDDVFGSRHHSTFCRIHDSRAFNGAGGFILPEAPGYNYGT